MVQEYAVTFTESGLPSGTDWNVTLNGTERSSNGPTIVFSEPDGTYPFFVGAVPGYSSNSGGNVTVKGGPVTEPILFALQQPPPPGCTSFSWIGGNYLFSGDCLGTFRVDYRSVNSTTQVVTDENSTFEVGAVAEVASNEAVDALGVPGYQGYGLITVSSTPTEINVTDVITGNVTNAIGVNSTTNRPDGQTPLWTPTQAPGGGAATNWGHGDQVLGSTTITVVFHFSNESGNTSDRVEFAVSVAGWPWVSTSDALGIEVGATAEGGTHLAYSAASATLSDIWNSQGTVATNLTFGPTANATGGTASVLRVTDQVGFFPSGPNPIAAIVLVTFNGPGGYSNLTYDPWIFFGPSSVTPVVITTAAIAATLPVAAVGAIAVAVGGLGWVAYRARRRSVEEDLI